MQIASHFSADAQSEFGEIYSTNFFRRVTKNRVRNWRKKNPDNVPSVRLTDPKYEITYYPMFQRRNFKMWAAVPAARYLPITSCILQQYWLIRSRAITRAGELKIIIIKSVHKPLTPEEGRPLACTPLERNKHQINLEPWCRQNNQ